MGADAIAVIRPALFELADAVEESDDASDPCVTFSIPDRESELWVQVLAGVVNVAYPRQEDPTGLFADAVGELARAFELESWEPGRYATFAFDDIGLNELAQVVDRTFTGVLGVSPDEGLDVEFSRVATS
jgi:hypothetical protein